MEMIMASADGQGTIGLLDGWIELSDEAFRILSEDGALQFAFYIQDKSLTDLTAQASYTFDTWQASGSFAAKAQGSWMSGGTKDELTNLAEAAFDCRESYHVLLDQTKDDAVSNLDYYLEFASEAEVWSGTVSKTADAGTPNEPNADAGMPGPLTLPSNADIWKEFLGPYGFFGQYTGASMDEASLAEIHITFADLTGDGAEEMIVVRPETSDWSTEVMWWLEVYSYEDYVCVVKYSIPAMNNHAAAMRIDLLTDENGVGFLLEEGHVVGTGVGDEEWFDHISLLGPQTEWWDGRNDRSARSEDTILMFVWDDGTVKIGGHTIPEYFPDLY